MGCFLILSVLCLRAHELFKSSFLFLYTKHFLLLLCHLKYKETLNLLVLSRNFVPSIVLAAITSVTLYKNLRTHYFLHLPAKET